MKTLLISLYDCTTETSAALIKDDGSVEPVELSNNMYHLVYDRKWFDSEKEKAKFGRFLSEYDSVVVCEDGKIEKIK